MELVKLFDPPMQAGRSNLTIDEVVSEITTHRPEYQFILQMKFGAVRKLIEISAFKDVRNRLVAHNDKNASTGIETPGNSLQIDQIDWAVKALQELWAVILTADAGNPVSISTGEGLHLPAEYTEPWRKESEALIRRLSAND